MTRRTLLAAPALAAAALQLKAARLPIRKGILLSMLPKSLPMTDRFKLAREVGFDQIELPTMTDQKDAEEAKKASEMSGLKIHSVMNQAHWQFPLSSPDKEVVAKSMKGMETSLHNAKFWGAETVLLVPAVVTPQVTYAEAWKRSEKQIRELIPLAQELKVIIAVEEVWNKFLLSPLEFATYVDSFNSPWLKAYFDVGNVVLYGYPQDWIRTLRKRIVKLHFKDFKFQKRQAEFVNIRDGEINWKEIHAALGEIGYNGTATLEISGGDEAYLRDASHRLDLILNGE
jgi:L-ribulose-5-phosphate 3-epimerase